MAQKQVWLRDKANKQLDEITQQRKDKELSGASKVDAVADAIALLHKKECKQ